MLVAFSVSTSGSDEARAARRVTTTLDAPDAVHRFGPYVVGRAQPSDALAYCRADAEIFANSYPDVMPPIWSKERLAEADGLAPVRELAFAAYLAERWARL
jgi:hypothetical protein